MTTYPLAPLAYANDAIHRRTIAQTTNNAISGKLNVLSTLTLNSSATSTTLNDSRITPTNVILFVPTNADSLTAWKNGVYASAQGIGTATITHSSNAANDQTFKVVIIG